MLIETSNRDDWERFLETQLRVYSNKVEHLNNPSVTLNEIPTGLKIRIYYEVIEQNGGKKANEGWKTIDWI